MDVNEIIKDQQGQTRRLSLPAFFSIGLGIFLIPSWLILLGLIRSFKVFFSYLLYGCIIGALVFLLIGILSLYKMKTHPVTFNMKMWAILGIIVPAIILISVPLFLMKAYYECRVPNPKVAKEKLDRFGDEIGIKFPAQTRILSFWDGHFVRHFWRVKIEIEDKDLQSLKKQLPKEGKGLSSTKRFVTKFEDWKNGWITGWDPEKPEKYEAGELDRPNKTFLIDLDHPGKTIVYMQYFQE